MNAVKALKEGKAVEKPIYNHVTGLLDPPERIESPKILVIEGLHPFYDDRVNDLIDFRIYLDISGERACRRWGRAWPGLALPCWCISDWT
jgi:phosphoribulokinase